MSMTASEFYFNDADLEDFVRRVHGLNLIVRQNMLKAFRSEKDEMIQIAGIFVEASNREVSEGIRLMSPEFRQGFLTLFIMNGGNLDYLSA